MSWQRIDENTYIDDSLVTCMEYQLFIDEMCEQGEYYQPDHWTSYQYPKGQARAPILGVRHSDAVAFCKWLTVQEAREWKFRLPVREEKDGSPLESIEISPLGYWISSEDEANNLISLLFDHYNNDFTWAGVIPINPRKLDHALILNLANNLDQEIIGEFDRTLGQNYLLALNLDRNLTHTLILDHDDTSELGRALDRNLGRGRDLPRALEIILSGYLNRDSKSTPSYVHASSINPAIKFSHFLDLSLARVNNPARAREIVRIRDADRSLARIREHERARAQTQSHELGIAYVRARENALYSYIDLLTLQERIAGRSPAFEGIRLVKEQIR